jgi:hypothetical protein
VNLPDPGTPEYEVFVAAIEIAAYGPLKPGQHVFAAKVPWTRLMRLRDALTAAGIPWETVR